jgi:hypothetical protein
MVRAGIWTAWRWFSQCAKQPCLIVINYCETCSLARGMTGVVAAVAAVGVVVFNIYLAEPVSNISKHTRAKHAKKATICK